jgi:tetratricopeptide (TPR) repeat protein
VDQQLNLESNIAWAYHEMGNLIKSAEANQKTLDIALANQHELFAAQSSYLLGRDCLAMGNYRLADRMLTQARKICAEISNNDLAIDILLGQIELALATGDSQRAGHLLDDFQSRKNPGKKQILTGGLYRARWLALKCDNNAELEYNKLIEQIIEPEFFDITINAITDLAQIKLSAGALDQARQLIARLDSFKVQNVLMILQMQITQGGLYRKLRQFDDALDTIKSVKKQAEISGCMPEYFRACLIEAEIYRDCGKNANLAIIIARLEKMHLAMLRSFPEERQTASLQNLPYINRYLKLLSVSADKAVAAKI